MFLKIIYEESLMTLATTLKHHMTAARIILLLQSHIQKITQYTQKLEAYAPKVRT